MTRRHQSSVSISGPFTDLWNSTFSAINLPCFPPSIARRSPRREAAVTVTGSVLTGPRNSASRRSAISPIRRKAVSSSARFVMRVATACDVATLADGRIALSMDALRIARRDIRGMSLDRRRAGLSTASGNANAELCAVGKPFAILTPRASVANRSTLLLGGAFYSGLVERSPNRADRHRRNLRLILLRLFGFAIAVLLSFRHGRSPSIHIGSREADMARSRRRERTRTNKNAPSLHPRSACYCRAMCGRFT